MNQRTPGSAMLLDRGHFVDRLDVMLNNPQTPVSDLGKERPNRQMSPAAQHIFDTTNKQVKQIFDFAEKRIGDCRVALSTAEQTLKMKRETLLDALEDFVFSVQELEVKATQMQEAIADVILDVSRVELPKTGC